MGRHNANFMYTGNLFFCLFVLFYPTLTFFCEHYEGYDHLVLVKTSWVFIRSILINAIIRHLNKG